MYIHAWTDFSECFYEGSINYQVISNVSFDGLLYTYEGPVEICVNGQYESVCDIGWDQVDAKIVCRSLFSLVGKKYNNICPIATCMYNTILPTKLIAGEPLYGLGEPSRRYISRMYNCSEMDHRLRNCNYSPDIDPECNNGPHVAGVRCKPRESNP